MRLGNKEEAIKDIKIKTQRKGVVYKKIMLEKNKKIVFWKKWGEVTKPLGKSEASGSDVG